MEPMSTEPTDIVTGNETQVEKAEPELKTGDAPQDVPKEGDQSPADEGKADDPQKTITKLLRRIERQSGKLGGTARENETLRAEVERLRSLSTADEVNQTTQPAADIEVRAQAKAHEIVRVQSLNEKADAVIKAGKDRKSVV